jgi:Rad3-related DNA helicase
MKTEQEEVKHTPLPWKADEKNWLSITDRSDGFGNLVCQTNGKGRAEADANRSFILEACNNYYSLKEEKDHWLNHAKEVAESNRKLQEENKELRQKLHDHNGMCQQKLNEQLNEVLPEIKSLKEENERLKRNEIISNEERKLHAEECNKLRNQLTEAAKSSLQSDSEVKTLREALETCKNLSTGYKANNLVAINRVSKEALQSKGE